jgi:hypothetical protein
MLRSILHGILEADESFFIHFQREFREFKAGNSSKWPYKSLQQILSSLADHPFEQQIFLILDAMDESEEKDRKEMVELLCGLCSGSRRCIIKIFLASRPISELQSQVHDLGKHQIIRLQDQNAGDISRFTAAFLEHELMLTGQDLEDIKAYILKHAEGVFVWVHLIKQELLAFPATGYGRNDIFDYLKSLPTEIKELYAYILTRLEKGNPRDIRDGVRMLRITLFALRPLNIGELQHLLAISNYSDPLAIPTEEGFRHTTIKDIEKRVMHCGGGFLEVKGHDASGTLLIL